MIYLKMREISHDLQGQLGGFLPGKSLLKMKEICQLLWNWQEFNKGNICLAHPV
jgi:hypothetical protein